MKLSDHKFTADIIGGPLCGHAVSFRLDEFPEEIKFAIGGVVYRYVHALRSVDETDCFIYETDDNYAGGRTL